MRNDTICAIATPPGHGGVGIVRLSGPNARRILSELWRGRVGVSDFKPRRLYLGDIIKLSGLGSRAPEEKIRALAVHMPAPSTYTSEDVVELSAHGSPIVLGSLLDACVSRGARLAEPGEFTRRAFLAGKIDLAQAEGVADLIAATSDRAARLASDQLEGKLSARVIGMGDKIAAFRAEIEASIDFPEEGIDPPAADTARKTMEAIRDAIDLLRKSFGRGRQVREGVRIAIAGAPNAGKSSLLNQLAGCDRAIVHHAPGTTRDVVEEIVSLDGSVFRLRDTAGIRSHAGEVEALGISRAMNEISAADLVLAVFDTSRPWSDDDDAVLRALDPAKTIAVQNKVDLPGVPDTSPLEKWLKNSSAVRASAKTGQGIEELSSRLVEASAIDEGACEGVVVTNARHKALLDETSKHLTQALDALSASVPLECIAQHLRSAQETLGGITGAVATEALLDRIFSQFCIGK